jgi:predicted metal-dependent enzyme (double-stranded beta helix superfamily)
MGQVLDQFAAQAHDILGGDTGDEGLSKVSRLLEDVLKNQEFVAEYLGPEIDSPRNILYEDPELKFCIIAHVYEGAKQSTPHDHGPSWAIYGQAKGVTTMTEWRKLEDPDGDKPGRVEATGSYDLEPGMARYYVVGQLHSPARASSTRLIRIEGQDLSKVKRDKYEAVETV